MLKGHEGAVLAARFNSNGEYCLSCGKDRTVRLWNPHRGIHIKTYKSHGREVRDVHVTPDNSKLCSCGGDRQVFYWDVASGRVIRKFRGHDSEVNAVKFNEYATIVVSAGNDHSLRAWDCRSHSTEPIQIIDTFRDTVMSVCLTKTEIIAGSVDGTVRTFDIRIGRFLMTWANLSTASLCQMMVIVYWQAAWIQLYDYWTDLLVNFCKNIKVILASHLRWTAVSQTVMRM